MTTVRLKGVDRVIHNLNREIKLIHGTTMKGLIRATILIRRSMDKNPPLIPVDTNNLRSSWATEPLEHIKHPAIMMGFTAAYAWFVHENYGAHFQRPGAGAGFFSAAIKNNKKQILDVIKKEAKIKK